MHRHHSCASILPLLAAAVVGACGGSDDRQDALSTSPTASAQAEPNSVLLDDSGLPMPAAAIAVPGDAGARTRSGRYTSEVQADQLEQALSGAVVRVDIECCGYAAAELAMGIAFGLQIAHDLPNNAPVLVRSADQRLGAAMVNRLTDAGYPNVWLVTQ